jgi:UDP-2,3-diacylglucosamine hydrolase
MSTWPPLPELHAPAHWRCIEFISDLHLATDTPRSLQAWQHYMQNTQADAVCILGDLVEVWVGDDARFEGFEAHFAQALTTCARQRWVGFMPGNRDFLLGQDMLTACGVHALADPCVLHAFGSRSVLTHGDALCLADTDYQRFRTMVREPAWQTQFLAQPLAARRAFARSVRAESERRKHSGGPTGASELWADVDPPAALQWLQQAQADTLVHGHTHRPATLPIAPGHVRHVLSDWDLDHPPLRAQTLRLTREGWQRIDLAAA